MENLKKLKDENLCKTKKNSCDISFLISGAGVYKAKRLFEQKQQQKMAPSPLSSNMQIWATTTMKRSAWSIGRSTPVRNGGGGGSHSNKNSPYLNLSGRRGAFQPANLTNGQLADMYSKCVQLSQHGKINQKNAWNLQLVDYINNIIQLDEQTNFTKASHTIDAASKIYGSRVDSVHQDTFKTLGTFQQTDAVAKKKYGGENGTADDEANARRKEERKSRNRNVGKNTIASSDEAISEIWKNLVVKVDPLFHKTATAFDEGGAKGLLMNQLYVQNGCEVVFDGSTLLEQNNAHSSALKPEEEEEEEKEEKEKEVDEGKSAMEEEWIKDLSQRAFGKTMAEGAEDDNREELDLLWIEDTTLCPLIEHFVSGIGDLAKGMKAEDFRRILEEPDASCGGRQKVNANANEEVDSDNDVVVEMKRDNITHNGFPATFDNINMNAMQLFHDDDLDGPGDVDIALQPMPDAHLLQPHDANLAIGDIDDAFHLEQRLAGKDMQPIITGQLKNSGASMHCFVIFFFFFFFNELCFVLFYMQFSVDPQTALAMMQLQRPQLSKSVNLQAMNQFIETLEHADLENVTTLFDSKKHGNWTGPDNWYHRRYQLTLERQKHLAELENAKTEDKTEANGDQDDEPETDKTTKKKKTSKSRGGESKYLDFMGIASKKFVADKDFAPPQRNFNCLTERVLQMNEQKLYQLPKDLGVKPDVFIKMFNKPTYSVWKHWLKTYHAHAKLVAEQAKHAPENADAQQPIAMDAGGNIDMQQIQAMQAASNAGQADDNNHNIGGINSNDNDDELDPHFYDYQNPNDQTNFVPNVPLLDDKGLRADGPAVHDLPRVQDSEQFDMVEAPMQVNKISIDFATKAKKVDVRNLKSRLWEQISVTVNTIGILIIFAFVCLYVYYTYTYIYIYIYIFCPFLQKEPESENINPNVPSEETNNKTEPEDLSAPKTNTFMNSMIGLEKTVDSKELQNISVSFCFICLLHLANEQNLVLKADETEVGGDFAILVTFVHQTSLLLASFGFTNKGISLYVNKTCFLHAGDILVGQNVCKKKINNVSFSVHF
ncbi:hypothetical protein RFI_31638 [Reticulomyxa filosa]|uniref:Condensin complex subunit 2 n=1 Tax=Reticulomyxa filosa TaxID=46433 RepID=X6LX92_RETFI|nr:hypothetical protein RFI_31638 [Reticulomyxa filosa]|eukprot:ETO05757.1 hypothetical protein RFI_31638 [Reticulomyxa filosa]